MLSGPLRRLHIRNLQTCILTRKAYSTNVKQFLDAFQQANEAAFVAAASSINSIPNLGGLPEVIVAGQPYSVANAGKSTLLNAVLGRTNLVRKSKKAGRTRALNFFRVGRDPGQLVVVDAPGYGARGRGEWGVLWDHYVDTRETLRQICLLINAQHGLTDYDRAMLTSLSEKYSSKNPSARLPSLQPILTKTDKLTGSDEARSLAVRIITTQVKKLAPRAEIPIVCALAPKFQFGVEAVRETMARACRS